MLGVCKVVYSMFVCLHGHSPLQSFKCACVGGMDTHCVHIQSSLSVFTKLGTAVLSSLHSGVVVQL